jgi:NAD(P)-dependent dehydrogenase (short-subunit alcohol dehydrogenase family)
MKDDRRLTAVITGAARGLGRAYARKLAEHGMNVVAADINDAESTAQEVERLGGTGVAVSCDIGSREAVDALADVVQERFGGCDVLVNNAAIFSRHGLMETAPEEWNAILRVNLDAMLHTCQRFVPGMRERGWGRVVNVSSTTFEIVMDGSLAYVTTKAAIIGFTRALASEVGPDGVTVNALMPGLTRTEITTEEAAAGVIDFEAMAQMQAVRHVVETDHLADVLSFVVSDASRMMTGQTFVVDGGLVRH